MVSESLNSLKDYVDTWYPLIESLEPKRLEAKQHQLDYHFKAAPSSA